MFYGGNPRNPTEYNPARNVGDTSDQNTLRPIETSEVFTQSVPSGDRTINGILVTVVSGDRLNISGPSPSYIYGPINSTLTLAGGAQFGDGSATAPSITFINDPDTGIYRDGSGAVSFTSNTNPTVTIGPNLQTSVPITTPGGQNLVLNPSGPSVDFTGHSIINAILPGSTALPRFQVSELEINVVGFAETPVGYVPWRVASWIGTALRTFYVWVVPGGRSLTLRARDNGGAVIGTTTVPGGFPVGLYSFTITAPAVDTRVDVTVQAGPGPGSSPRVFGIILEGT
jgi:hypothetical protein